MRRRVRWFVLLGLSALSLFRAALRILPARIDPLVLPGETDQVDDTARHVRLDVALEGRGAMGDGGEVAGADRKLAVVLEEEGPIGGVGNGGGLLGRRLDRVLVVVDDVHLAAGHLGSFGAAVAAMQKWAESGSSKENAAGRCRGTRGRCRGCVVAGWDLGGCGVGRAQVRESFQFFFSLASWKGGENLGSWR